jgi:hypothetical protein
LLHANFDLLIFTTIQIYNRVRLVASILEEGLGTEKADIAVTVFCTKVGSLWLSNFVLRDYTNAIW